jgi:hypothetical protein
MGPLERGMDPPEGFATEEINTNMKNLHVLAVFGPRIFPTLHRGFCMGKLKGTFCTEMFEKHCKICGNVLLMSVLPPVHRWQNDEGSQSSNNYQLLINFNDRRVPSYSTMFWHFKTFGLLRSVIIGMVLCRDSVVGIATSYWLEDRGDWVWVPVGLKIFLRDVQTRSGAHPATYPMGTGGSLPGSTASGAWSWLLTSN